MFQVNEKQPISWKALKASFPARTEKQLILKTSSFVRRWPQTPPNWSYSKWVYFKINFWNKSTALFWVEELCPKISSWIKSFFWWLVRWQGWRSLYGHLRRQKTAPCARTQLLNVTYPAQIGPGIHRHQRVSDPSNHACQSGQTFWNSPVRNKKGSITPR